MSLETKRSIVGRSNSKRARRKENRKRKLNALIELSTVNGVNQKRSLSGKPLEKSKIVNDTEGGPARKRLRKDVEFLLNGQEKSTEVPPVFGELTEEQKKQVKKQLEQRTKKRLERPILVLTEIGEAADILTTAERRVPLTLDDFQHFMIYSLFTIMSTKGVSRWVQMVKPEKVKRRIFLVVEGAGLTEYLENETNLKALKEFETRLEVTSPLSYGANLTEELALVPLTNTQKNKLLSEYGSLKKAMDAGEVFQAFRTMFKISPMSSEKTLPKKGIPLISPDKFSRKKLLLTPWEMFEDNYPLPIAGNYGLKFKDFLPTRDEYSEVTENSPMWSVDCEMCLTHAGSELTRICIVNESHDIVYESLVKPHNPIINYLTPYSGITAKLLEGVKTTLEDVQQHVRAICPPDVIFIGQSLNNDLIALKMIHPFVIDTSVIFNLSGMKNKKSKLSVLTEEFLSERIQLGKSGHSPIEDALAAMKLVQAKLQHSFSWGNAVLCGPRPEEEVIAAQNLLQLREKAGVDRLKPLTESSSLSNFQLPEHEELLSKSLFSHLTRYNKTVQLVGKEALLDGYYQYLIPSEEIKVQPVRTDRLAIKEVKQNSPLGGVSICHISLNLQSPSKAITKADRLVSKLLRDPSPSTLYTILLAGRPGSPGNGLVFLHLLREHIPLVGLPSSS